VSGRYAIYVCGVDETPVRQPSDCPKARLHAKEPSGYGPWFEWATKKGRTHTQQRCPDCGLFKVWKRKR
jgi:hypothetical protein